MTCVLSASHVCSLPVQHMFQSGGYDTLSFSHGDCLYTARIVSSTQPWRLLKSVEYLDNTQHQPHAQSHHSAPSKMWYTTTKPKEKIRPKGARYLWTMTLNQPTTSPRGSNLPPGNPRPGACPLWYYDDVVTLCPPPPHPTQRWQ